MAAKRAGPLRRSPVADFAVAHTHYLVAAWATGVLLLTLRTGAGLAWIARSSTAPAAGRWERRTAELAKRMGIRRRVRVRMVKGLDSPVTAGWRRPLILLPDALAGSIAPAQLDALLGHELAHIQRHDYLANLLQTFICSLLFFHPVVWWLARRIDAERELLADGAAARVLGDPRSLAEALAELDRHRHGSLHPAQAASGGELLTRIRVLLTPQAAALKLHTVLPALLLAVGGVAFAAHAAATAAGEVLTSRAIVNFAHCAKPVWPAEALAAEHTGKVTLRFQIGRDGWVSGSEVVRSSGHAALDQAAREGIGKCRFMPAHVDGMPGASSTQRQYVWTLQ
jgi:D-alanyl-D-alanine endopeptidase (penicillin-binding protein 7)